MSDTGNKRARLAVWVPSLTDAKELAKVHTNFKRGRYVEARNGNGGWLYEYGAKDRFNGAVQNVMRHELTTEVDWKIGWGADAVVVHTTVALGKAMARKPEVRV